MLEKCYMHRKRCCNMHVLGCNCANSLSRPLGLGSRVTQRRGGTVLGGKGEAKKAMVAARPGRRGGDQGSTGQRARERAEHGLRLEEHPGGVHGNRAWLVWGVARRGGTAASRDFDRVAATLTATLTETLTVTLLLLLRLLRVFTATLTGLCCGCCGCCGCGCGCCCAAAAAAGRPPPWRT